MSSACTLQSLSSQTSSATPPGLHFTLSTPHFAHHTPHSTLSTSHFVPRTPHSTLHTSHSTLHTSLSTLHTPHSPLHASHSPLHTSHSALHNLHFTISTPLHTCTLPHFTLHTLHSILHTLHFTLHTSHSPLRTPHFTLHTSHIKHETSHSTLQTSHSTLATSHSTLHTPHFTFHTPHSTLSTSHSTLPNSNSPLRTPHFTHHTSHVHTTHSYPDCHQAPRLPHEMHIRNFKTSRSVAIPRGRARRDYSPATRNDPQTRLHPQTPHQEKQEPFAMHSGKSGFAFWTFNGSNLIVDFSSIMILQTCNMRILELVDTCKTNQSRLQKIWGQYTTYSGAKAGCSTINQPLGKGHLGARLDSSHRGKLNIYSNILSDILLDFLCGILIWIQVRRGAKSWRAHYTCQVRRGPAGGTKELASFLHRSRVAQDGLLERLASWRGRRRRSNRDVLLKCRDPHLARVPVLNIPSNQCMILSWTLSESLISGCLGTLGTWLQHD